MRQLDTVVLAMTSSEVSSYEDLGAVLTITDRMLGKVYLRSILAKDIAENYFGDQGEYQV